ncbi:CheR family methyltransferase [Lacimicrobium sp. SS2-24]|uniref:CheR family methyltransferase n=1 Tax=Lacimicrobium sp. SS2-24 TaxID=2005569 RepID=UPI000B4B7088|nr:CheR family methyltransferase [Lacimicrobium sp. SS2-24]
MQSEVREFEFDQRDFNRVREVLYNAAGIKLADSKDSMVYSRLARRLRVLKIPSFADYLQFLAENQQEVEHFVNGLTTNLTSFFREHHHFEALYRYFQQAHGRQRIWCTASSTGEEAYSIAMCAAEAYRSLTPPVEILATDIDSNVLRTAMAGVYLQARIADISPGRVKRFFFKGKGANEGKVKVVSELRDLIRFQRLNLTEGAWQGIEGPFDVVFCRNVMIYFDKPTQLRVLNRLAALLKDDGLYFAGHSESFLNASALIKPIGKTVYRKVRTPSP